jgi:Tfp pilus assembly PilM family ATPase
MSKKDKDRILATNRLLEILREERGSEDEKKPEDETVDSELVKESKEEELLHTSQSDSGKTSETSESKEEELLRTSKSISDKTSETSESKEIKNGGIEQEPALELSEDENVDSETSAEAVDPDKDHLRPNIFNRLKSKKTPTQDLDTTKSEQSRLSRLTEEYKNDLALKTELPKDSEGSENGDGVMPPEYNESLITFYEEATEKSKWRKFARYLKRAFANSQRKISICIDQNSIYLLQTYLVANKTEVEKVKSYSLPYEYEDQLITGINELLSHVLENEIDPKDKKRSFGAYFSVNTPSKTTMITSPKIKKTELSELIEWHAVKNLSFSPENKNVNWEIVKSGTGGETLDVIIGVTDNVSVSTIDSIFKNSGIKLRFTSTLPILLWKSFVKNYPDRDVGSYIIIHMGESKTLVIVVTDHIIKFSREIAIGAQDFYKAIIKNIERDESGHTIDITLAKDLLLKYGYSLNLSGLAANYNVDLNKVTVAIRPIVERIISELNRTLNFFKTQSSTLDWKQFLCGGIVSSFPGLLETIGDNIFQKVGLLNPVRTGEYDIKDEIGLVPQQYPQYVLNFALMSDEVEKFNVSSKHIREYNKYTFYSNIVATILAILVPIFLFTGFYSNFKIKRGHRIVQTKKTELQRLAIETKDYESMVGDIKVINSSDKFLKNDKIYSDNQIRMLKLFSSIVPKELKLTSLNFVNAIGLPDSVVNAADFKEHIEITGFVDNYRSAADIHLADFILRLGKMRQFSNVRTIDKSNSIYLGKDQLFFTLSLNLR